MADINVIPQVWLQEQSAGAVLAGAAPAGVAMVDSGETLYRGMYRKHTVCTAAGLFQIPAAFNCGYRLERLVWDTPGGGNFTVSLVDDDGLDHKLEVTAAVFGVYVPRENGGILVPPGWAIKAVTSGVLASAGRVIAYLRNGWVTGAFVGAGAIGAEDLPPMKQQP